jgi:hypothetical protein
MAPGTGPHAVRHVVPVAQRDVARCVVDRQGGVLLAACDLGTGGGKHDAVRFTTGSGIHVQSVLPEP